MHIYLHRIYELVENFEQNMKILNKYLHNICSYATQGLEPWTFARLGDGAPTELDKGYITCPPKAAGFSN